MIVRLVSFGVRNAALWADPAAVLTVSRAYDPAMRLKQKSGQSQLKIQIFSKQTA